jgi:hypothetical protein
MKFFSEYKMSTKNLNDIYREIDTLNLLKQSKEKIITHDKTTELKEAIDVLYWALVDFTEMNPDMHEEIDSSWKLIMERVE